MTINADLDQQWQRAIEDAGLNPDDCSLLVSDVTHDAAEMPVVYLPPGGPLGSAMVPGLDRGQLTALQADRHRHRIAVVGTLRSQELLALLRWALDQARQFDSDSELWRFGWTVLDTALVRQYGTRTGGGTLHNAVPSVRDASEAARKLVNRTFGEQFGDYYTTFGTLFRFVGDFGGDATLARRNVVFAALHRAGLVEAAGDESVAREFVAQAHPEAGGWWDALVADEGVGHFAAVLQFFIPTDAEIDEAQPAPAEAWRPLVAVLDRGMAHGLTVIES